MNLGVGVQLGGHGLLGHDLLALIKSVEHHAWTAASPASGRTAALLLQTRW